MTSPFDSFEVEDWEDLFEGEHFDFMTVSGEQASGQRRWTTVYYQVFKHRESSTFWRVYWERGNTEYQETEPNYTWEQVEPYQVTVTKYRRIT